MKKIVLILLLISFQTKSIPSLDQLGDKYNCLKGSSHNYLVVYESYFNSLQNNNLKFLEIGFGNGASAYMWEEYFPNAELHYIDNHPDAVQYRLPNRSKLHMMNQNDEEKLIALAHQVGEFDIIIDDGGHVMDDQKCSFRTLFPFVRSGGMYIIEDLHTSYWKPYGGEGNTGNPRPSKNSTTEFLKSLVDNVNYVGAYTGAANRQMALNRVKTGKDEYGTYNFPKDLFETMNYYSKHIKSIHFYDSVCCILKW